MGLDQIAEVLYSCKPPLSVVDVSRVYSCGTDINHRRGALIAAYVTSWLTKTPSIDFDRKIPRKVNGLQVQQNLSGGVDVFEGKPRIAEYEGLVNIHGHPTIVEVKASKLNGYANRLPKHLEIAGRVYGRDDVNALLFISYAGIEPRHRRSLTDQFAPHLQIIDTQFSQEEVDDYLRRNEKIFGSSRSSGKRGANLRSPNKTGGGRRTR